MIRSFPRCMALLGILLQCGGTLQAHDLWLQTNTTVVRTGDVVHIDCMLGNHGNDHRDFKLAGKPGIETIKNLEVILPKCRRRLPHMRHSPDAKAALTEPEIQHYGLATVLRHGMLFSSEVGDFPLRRG